MSGVAALDGVDDRDVPKMELLAAAFNSDTAKIAELLRTGVHVDATDDDGVTALQIAASNGNNSLVVFLLEREAEIDSCNQLGMTPFHHAAREGKLNVIDTLLQRGAAFNKQTYLGANALTLAAAGGHTDVVKKLLAIGVEASPRNRSLAPTPLIAATASRNSQICGILTQRGAPIDEIKEALMGLSALSTAIVCTPGSYMVSSLLDLGANPDKKSLWRKSAIELAKAFKRIDVVNLLFEKRTRHREPSGNPQIRQSIFEDKLDSVGNVIHLDQPSPDGCTFLMFATTVRSLSSMRRLLDLRVDVNSRDAMHINALQISCLLRFDEGSLLLLAHGSPTVEVNRYSLTAYDLFMLSNESSESALRKQLNPYRAHPPELRLSLSHSSSTLPKEWLSRVSWPIGLISNDRSSDGSRIETKQWLDAFSKWHPSKERNPSRLVLVDDVLRGTKTLRIPERNDLDAVTDTMRGMIEDAHSFLCPSFFDAYGLKEDLKKGQEELLVYHKHYDIAQYHAHTSGYQSNRRWNPRNSLVLHRREGSDTTVERRKPRTIASVELPSQNQMRTTPRMLKKSRESMIVDESSRLYRRSTSAAQLVQIPTILSAAPLRARPVGVPVTEEQIWQTMCKYGLKEYVSVLQDEEIDKQVFFSLTDEDFKNLGIRNSKHRAVIVEIQKALLNTS
ncbi:unnamed protein product [Caenorhabditis auriculariae]|uniref:NAD(+) ADP-ribosyltransferase n=1 Tax=Caenorhabditis auriculariae TaxID=2777116 RepID=A0A8S1HKU8_9PELO|nr:unnamed protein product [Caenorhabditis auriculariae]